MNTQKTTERTALTILSIDGHDYQLPATSDLAAVLKALAGMRKIHSESFYYLEPSRTIVRDDGPAEFSVSAWHRELVGDEEYAQLKAGEKEAREKIRPDGKEAK